MHTTEMNTLPNVDTRRGEYNPPAPDLPPAASPEKHNLPEGVSSSFAPPQDKQWFILRATYGRTETACEELKKEGVRIYMPMHSTLKETRGKKKRVQEPLIPNIIFAYMTRKQASGFVKEPAPTASYLKYYVDKTQPKESSTGLNPPVTVPDNEMENFIKATSVLSGHVMMLPKERCHYKSGELVKITAGDFAGVVGKVVRAAGQQRVALDIKGLGTFVTAYIPSDFLMKI